MRDFIISTLTLHQDSSGESFSSRIATTLILYHRRNFHAYVRLSALWWELWLLLHESGREVFLLTGYASFLLSMMKSAARSPIMMVEALVLARTTSGMMEASTTRNPSTPWTRQN